MYTDWVFYTLSIIGIVAFSVSGAMVGIKYKADIFGVVALGTVTATGGGILRDILLGLLPPASILDNSYIIIASLCSLVVFLCAYTDKYEYSKNSQNLDAVTNILDALGLGVFTVSGTDAAMNFGFFASPVTCVLICTITAIGGGIFRDILVSQIPCVFKKRIYALAAILGSSLFYALTILALPYAVCAFSALATTFFLRLAATYYRWNLPTIYCKGRFKK